MVSLLIIKKTQRNHGEQQLDIVIEIFKARVIIQID